MVMLILISDFDSLVANGSVAALDRFQEILDECDMTRFQQCHNKQML